MEAITPSPLSVEQLQSQVNALNAKIAHLNDLMCKVREHKHNHSDDFGWVVSVPVKSLLKELINNPTIFSVEERECIVDMFSKSMEMRGVYECLGWPVEIQLSKVRNEMVPLIRRNVGFYSSLVGKATVFTDKWLVNKMTMALNEADGLCKALENIEHFEYGESKPFNLKKAIKETFEKSISRKSIFGEQSILIDWFCGEYSELKVDMNRESFIRYLLGNIIKNLYDHAFKKTNDYLLQETSNLKKGESSWSNNGKEHFADCNFAGVSPVLGQERRVRISLKKDQTNEHRINLIIENNGNPFKGDVNKIFEKGIGEGEGEHIGLYSAKMFLQAYGATITMYTKSDTEFKVGFLINMPIYEQ